MNAQTDLRMDGETDREVVEQLEHTEKKILLRQTNSDTDTQTIQEKW